MPLQGRCSANLSVHRLQRLLTQQGDHVQRGADLADNAPRVKRAGNCALQQNIGALQITVQEPQGVKVPHPLGNVCQAQQAADLHTTFLVRATAGVIS